MLLLLYYYIIIKVYNCLVFPRRCNTGEGIFRFKTTNNDGLAIYRVVHANSETRAKLNSSSALPRPPSPPALPTTIENVYDCIDESAMTPTVRKD